MALILETVDFVGENEWSRGRGESRDKGIFFFFLLFVEWTSVFSLFICPLFYETTSFMIERVNYYIENVWIVSDIKGSISSVCVNDVFMARGFQNQLVRETFFFF